MSSFDTFLFYEENVDFFKKFMDILSFQIQFRIQEINFLILEKTFENFLRRRFRWLKEKENEIFEENVTNNYLRKNVYQKDGRHYQSVMNGHNHDRHSQKRRCQQWLTMLCSPLCHCTREKCKGVQLGSVVYVYCSKDLHLPQPRTCHGLRRM